MKRYVTVEHALRSAAPHRLHEALRAALTEQYAITGAELLLADYGLTALQPVTSGPHPEDPVPVHGSAPGRAFATQQPFIEQHPGRAVVHLPVSLRGDRLGVLSVAAPGHGRPEAMVDELADIAGVLAREVVVAERDTDVYLQARRRDRLTLAAEMQWQLLPARACVRAEYALGVQLEPAYAICGDNVDWSADADQLTLAVSSGTGHGIEAALLTQLAMNALRNARRAGIRLADQAALADQALYAQYRGDAHLPILLLRFELASGRVEVVDAGSPRLLRLRDGKVERVPFEAQLPLGMFEETDYVAQEFRVEPGDRLVFVSDGVHAVASSAGERHGERPLARAITATRLLPAAQVPHAVLHQLSGRRGDPPAEEDAVVVCLDWYGREDLGRSAPGRQRK